MTSTAIPSFEEYLASLTPVSPPPAGVPPETLELCGRATAHVVASLPLTQKKLADIIRAEPQAVPVLAAAVNLSRERLMTWLKATFDTAGWIKLASTRATDLASAFEDSFGLVAALQAQAQRDWTWADVLARTMSPPSAGKSAVRQGRDLEDVVEEAIRVLELPFAPRGRFDGTAGRSAPVDFAIPDAGAQTLIAVAVKGYDSTGSVLTHAKREIEEMATVRKPTQFIFAIADGHGWLRRAEDLRRIHGLWQSGRIDGLYNRATIDTFSTALSAAARRVGLI